MFKKAGLLLSLLVLVLWGGVAYAELNLQDGEWEITSKMEMKGMPMEMPATKTTKCLSNKDAVPEKPKKNQDCKTISKKVEGNTVTWVIQCSDKEGNTIDSRGKITYKGTTFDGVVEMDMSGKEGKQHMSQKITGKRIGDCTK